MLVPSIYLNILKKFKTLILVQFSFPLINIILLYTYGIGSSLDTVAHCRMITLIFAGISFYIIYLKRVYILSSEIIFELVKRISSILISIIALYFSKNIEFYNLINSAEPTHILLYDSSKMILSMLSFTMISFLCFSIIYKKEYFSSKIFSIIISIKSLKNGGKVK